MQNKFIHSHQDDPYRLKALAGTLIAVGRSLHRQQRQDLAWQSYADFALELDFWAVSEKSVVFLRGERRFPLS